MDNLDELAVEDIPSRCLSYTFLQSGQNKRCVRSYDHSDSEEHLWVEAIRSNGCFQIVRWGETKGTRTWLLGPDEFVLGHEWKEFDSYRLKCIHCEQMIAHPDRFDLSLEQLQPKPCIFRTIGDPW